VRPLGLVCKTDPSLRVADALPRVLPLDRKATCPSAAAA
jgi:hypothetical protein